MQTTHRCATCQEPFVPKRGRTQQRYCSADCYYARNNNRVLEPRVCEVCEQEFWPEDEPGRGKVQRACSRKCSDALKRRGEMRKCGWCNKEFYVQRAESDRRACCSRGCAIRLRMQQHQEEWVSGVRGRYVGSNGYVILQLPPGERHKHSARDERGRIMEHRYVMEKHLGRPLERTEVVHHKNGNRSDNRLENLELWSQAHPPTQRVEDLVSYAHEVLALYGTGRDTLAHCPSCTCFGGPA